MNKRNKLKFQIFVSLAVALLIILSSTIYLFNQLSNFINKNNTILDNTQELLLNSSSINMNLHKFIDGHIQSIKTQKSLSNTSEYIELLNKEIISLNNKPTEYKNITSPLIIRTENVINVIADKQKSGYNQSDENNIIQILLNEQEKNIETIQSFNSSVISHRSDAIKKNITHITKVENIVIGLIALSLLIILFIFYKVFQIMQHLRKASHELKTINKDFQEARINIENTNWILETNGIIIDNISGVDDTSTISKIVIKELNTYLPLLAVAMYVRKPDSYEFELKEDIGLNHEQAIKLFISGEGFLGKVVEDKKIITKTIKETSNLKVESALVKDFNPIVFLVPLVHENLTLGLIEIVLDCEESENEKFKKFFVRLGRNIANRIKFGQSHSLVEHLLLETQTQTEELEAQQEELRITNEELIRKTHLLESSEEELRVQQEELTQTNIELNQKAVELEFRNGELNNAQKTVEQKISEVELASKYKSEFMANMSHELRTPLNSILILAKLLQDNKSKNLTPEQTKYANVIHGAGTDLLELINELLDLAKIESGKIELNPEKIRTLDFCDDTSDLFKEIAKDKGISFITKIEEGVPVEFYSDEYRIQQILKNFLSNAFKFTNSGGEVVFTTKLCNQNLLFEVKDSGKGISQEKQDLIFEAFRQEDGSTSRKYGGTGLGLSISREIASLLGGRITLSSIPDLGSTFTLIMPYDESNETISKGIETLIQQNNTPNIKEEKNVPLIDVNNRNILIIEDDINFADILKGFAEDYGYNVSLAHDGSNGIKMAKESIPDAIILDVMLPIFDGWQVLNELKSDPNTRHIPIHMMSAATFSKKEFLEKGAIGFIHKPVTDATIQKTFENININLSKSVKKILLIEDQEYQSDYIKNTFSEHNINVIQAFTIHSAWAKLNTESNIDCIILDLELPDGNGMELIEKIKVNENLANIPIIINTAHELPKEQYEKIISDARATILKSDKSSERLIDEVNLFLNKIQDNSYQPIKDIENIKESNALKGKKVLIADDDMRNVFALTTSLQSFDMEIEIANNGKEAVEIMQNDGAKIDIILMDIMMPEMDGHEAIKIIREELKYKNIPILAVTAKAMKGDREKTLQIGANDYISKPIDIDKLTSLMQVWLS